MPNWCWTDYIFHGSREDIDIFYKTLMNAKRNSVIGDYGFGRTWLGNVLAEVGLLEIVPDKKSYSGHYVKTPDDGKDYSCRGSFDLLDGYYDDEYPEDWSRNYRMDSRGNAMLSLTTTTAWDPMPNVWDRMFEKLGLDISYSLMATEEGGFYYVKHNCDLEYPDFKDNYYIDAYADLSGTTYAIRYGKRGKPLHRKGHVIFDKKTVEVTDTDRKVFELYDTGNKYYNNESEVIDILSDIFGVSKASVDEYKDLIDDYNQACSDRGCDNWLSVNKFVEYYSVDIWKEKNNYD